MDQKLKLLYAKRQCINIASFLFIFGLLLVQVCHINGASCIPGVSKFGSGKGPSYYWYCPPGAEVPKLVQCPYGNKWNRQSLLCDEKPPNISTYRGLNKKNRRSGGGSRRGGGENDNQDEVTIKEMAVLGRNVWLGNFYDAHRDSVINGYSLWNETMINENKVTTFDQNSNYKNLVEDSVNDRLAFFDIEAELKLSFLGGMIEVNGAAKYLRDSKEKENNVRYNMYFDATVKKESLGTKFRRELSYIDYCEKIQEEHMGPTHVISSIEYGINAVIIFEQSVSSNESKEEVAGSLRVKVTAVPQFSISGAANLTSNGSMKTDETNIKVKMYGDFIASTPPTDRESAARTYAEILKAVKDYKASEHGDTEIIKPNWNPAPIKMTITPIKEYCTDIQVFLASISSALNTKVSDILVDLEKLMVKVKTLESMFIANKFIDLSETLKLFRVNLDIYTTKMKVNIAQILPHARNTGEDEKLTDLLKDHQKHHFSYENGRVFLAERERELNVINLLFDDDMIHNGMIQIGDYKEANIVKAFAHKTYVFVYNFNVLSDKNVTQLFLDNITIDREAQWYNNDYLTGLASSRFREFKEFVNINKKSFKDQNFFIKGKPLNEDLLTEISVYVEGELRTPNLQIPKPPQKPEVVRITYNSVTLLLAKHEDIKSDSHITEIMVKYGNILANESDYQPVIVKINKEITNTTITIEIPVPEKDEIPRIYTFFTAFQTDFCRGKESEHLEDIIPLASSEPNLEPINHINSTAINLEWETPDIFPTTLDHPTYRVNISDGQEFNESFTTEKTKKTISGLSHATKYTGSVEIGFDDWKMQGETAHFDFYTIPSTPDRPTKVKVEKYDVTIELASRDNIEIAENAVFKNYQVTYYKINDESREMKGTRHSLDTKNNVVGISNLHPGTRYNFVYRVLTSKGTSQPSPPLHVTTEYNKTELEIINARVEKITTEQDDKIKLIMPLGTIMAWVNTIDKSSKEVPIPDGWQRCDGDLIKEPSIWAGKKTPNLNGEKRFLRGGADVDVMKTEEDQLQDHEHIFIDPGHSHGYPEEYVYDAGNHGGEWFRLGTRVENPTTVFTAKTNKAYTGINMGFVKQNSSYRIGAETRPKNMYVIYIMKVW